jgi:SAM-dependent methyltransferase
MSLSPSQWHARFRQQAGWTRQARQYLLRQAGLSGAQRFLETGCGTGAVLAELGEDFTSGLHGLDIRLDYLQLARRNAIGSRLAQGDAHSLPYATGSFEAACCHFLLLWVRDPAGVVAELKRVTQPGGVVLLMAEPDYGGRIDHPSELSILGKWQSQALRLAGANPYIGRELAGLLSQNGLAGIEWGVLGGGSSEPPAPQDWEMEWRVLRADLEQMLDTLPERMAEIETLQERDRLAWNRQERVQFVPTFYAWGRVPTGG